MKEIGGYLELECGEASSYHSNAYALSSACAGLRLVIRARNITRLYVPEYTCPVVWDAVKAERCECIFYKIGEDFFPEISLPTTEWILYNNYFGICARQTKQMAQQYPLLIVDDAQAFFMPHYGMASIYSPHKFFGVPDGGYLYCNFPVEYPAQYATSWQKCMHLLKRHDLGANAGYEDFKKIGAMIRADGIRRMSLLTEALLKNVDYAKCKAKRMSNFLYLHKKLQQRNLLSIELSADDVPMVYPLLSTRNGLRQQLIAAHVYVAQYWPGVPQSNLLDIIPLPIDQRYGAPEMDYILEILDRG